MARKLTKKPKLLRKKDLKRTKGGQGTTATPVTTQSIVSPGEVQKIPGNLKWEPITGITNPTSTTSAGPPT